MLKIYIKNLNNASNGDLNSLPIEKFNSFKHSLKFSSES